MSTLQTQKQSSKCGSNMQMVYVTTWEMNINTAKGQVAGMLWPAVQQNKNMYPGTIQDMEHTESRNKKKHFKTEMPKTENGISSN